MCPQPFMPTLTVTTSVTADSFCGGVNANDRVCRFCLNDVGPFEVDAWRSTCEGAGVVLATFTVQELEEFELVALDAALLTTHTALLNETGKYFATDAFGITVVMGEAFTSIPIELMTTLFPPITLDNGRDIRAATNAEMSCLNHSMLDAVINIMNAEITLDLCVSKHIPFFEDFIRGVMLLVVSLNAFWIVFRF